MVCNVVDGFRVVFPALPNSDYLSSNRSRVFEPQLQLGSTLFQDLVISVIL